MKFKPFYLISLFATLISCSNKVIKTDYYFKKNFNGEVAIVYDSKNADRGATIKDGRLQLLVPDSGIVFTSTSYKEGLSNSNFFIKNDNGKYDTLVRYYNQVDTGTGIKYVYFERIMSLGCDSSKEMHNVLFFNVGVRMDLQDKRSLFEQRVFKLLCEGR